jgi:hypothetical protein
MAIQLNPVRTRNTRVILAAAVVIAAGGSATPNVWAGPVEDNHRTCLAGTSGTADSLERWSDHCEAVGEAFATLYHDCMRRLGGSADSLEHWSDHCAQESLSSAPAVADHPAIAEMARTNGLSGLAPARLVSSTVPAGYGDNTAIAAWARANSLSGLSPASLAPDAE